jgi:uncharacterized membrane protein (UPF0127 family)/nicotinic acid mononucleotide adenylyltransferase
MEEEFYRGERGPISTKMKSYKDLKVNILEQTSNKSVVFTFGRFQPPTSGHQLLINKVIKEAQSRKAEHRIYPSHSTDIKQNPLSHKDKVLFMRKLFSNANIMDDKKAKNPFQVLDILYKEGYENVYFIVGGDRVPEFKKGMKKYTEGFKKFEIISAGERDPDAEGVVGMSGSKMRKAVADDEFEKFLKGVPSRTPKRISLGLFKAIRKGMGLKEEYVNFKEQTFDVRLADTDESRARGLMNVDSMSDDDGMFFVFDEENYHGIWMKNTYIPLDVVWINESGTIVDIATLQPHDLNTRMPAGPAKYVLEVNAGTFSGEIGDTLAEKTLLNKLKKKLKMDKFSRDERKRKKDKTKGIRKYNKMVGIPLSSSYDAELDESVQLDEQRRGLRKDVYAIVNRKGKVLSANLTKNNAHKEVTRHRDSIIVLDPDAKEGDNLKFFARESVELTELTKDARRKMARAARRTAKRRAMKRKIKSRKMKSSDDLIKKARRGAIMGFKKKMLKGRSWSSLGMQEREALETRMKKKYKPARIARVAQKMLPGIRSAERERIANLKGGGKKNEQVEYLTEPQALENLVKKLKSKNPSWSDSKAYAIATAQLQKSGVLKKGTHELEERNYKSEYANYQGKPEQIARRSSRNKARRAMEKDGKVCKGDGLDVDHKDRNPLNNDTGNLQAIDAGENRSFDRTVGEGVILKNKKHKKIPPLEDGTDRARKEYARMTPGQKLDNFIEQSIVDRVKEKHKRENERVKSKHDREIDTAKEREVSSKNRDNERESRKKRIGKTDVR